YDGDGKSDILWRASDVTLIWFMNGVTVASTANIGTVPATWTVQNVNAD
ncbi:MAG: hypothetical protein JO228_14885, partial [Xanthobacteraceae bacterium]|nr:hypothetical protein [Xanthobacteraceae bacterium]